MATAETKPRRKRGGKASDFRICPACQTRNKAKWDFCARCGESLQNVPLGMPEPAAGAEPIAVREAPGDFSLSGVLTALVAVAAFGVAAYFLARPPVAPENPDPEIFTMPTMPPAAPSTAAGGPADPDSDRAQQLYARAKALAARKQNAEALALVDESIQLADHPASRSLRGRIR